VISALSSSDALTATAILAEAFHDYPVMRYVLGRAGDYQARLLALVGFFVQARLLREELVLGARNPAGVVVAVALVSLPGERPSPPALDEHREELWRRMGAPARVRYERFGDASHQFDLAAPHHHLNMIGARRAVAGQGYGRRLLEAVHHQADTMPLSAGVSLSTETRGNVALYHHFGYSLQGHARVGPGLETWAFFRPARRRAETPAR
jgi:GNAT superfamily N-acetyltransferase